MSPQKNLLLCLNFGQRMIKERDLSLAPEFIAGNSVPHDRGLLNSPRAASAAAAT